MHAHAQVEGVLASILGHVLVGSNAGCLQSLTGDLLLLPTAQQGHSTLSLPAMTAELLPDSNISLLLSDMHSLQADWMAPRDCHAAWT